MSSLKIPFAERDGKILLINDLSEAERGKKCRCLCPACKAPLLARMGDVNVHHFAHSGEPCDITKIYLNAVYTLLKQGIDRLGRFSFPDCYLNHNGDHHHFQYAYTSTLASPPLPYNVKLVKGATVIPDSVEIKKNKNGVPLAAIFKKGSHEVAIIVRLPRTICKDAAPSKYKELTTLALNLDDFLEQDIFLGNTSRETEDLLVLPVAHKQWVHHVRAQEQIEQIRAKLKEESKLAEKQLNKYNDYLDRYNSSKPEIPNAASRRVTCIICNKTKSNSCFSISRKVKGICSECARTLSFSDYMKRAKEI